MANRVIRDSIWTSKSLAKISREAEAWYPRWILMADDWGCFRAEPEVVKGLAFPFRRDISESEIEGWLVEYYNSGHVFLWSDGEKLWGYFTAFELQNPHFNKTNSDDEGKNQKHRRKTPEPPSEAFSAYLKERQIITKLSDILGHLSTPSDKILNPNHNPNPNPQINTKDIPASPQKIAQPPSETKQALNEWIEKARASHRRIFGKDIKPAQVCLLAYGRNGNHTDCFGEIDILIKFWESLTGQKIDDPFTWSLACAKNRETVERFIKRI